MDLRSLPGHELIEKGLADLSSGRESVEALLVAIGAERLRRSGIAVPAAVPEDPEHRLYALLAADDSDSAHSRYNVMIRQLVSFERAAECVA